VVLIVIEKKPSRVRRPWGLLALMFFIQGCGFGWLYMKVGDSKRIAALKLLSYDTKESRFLTAQKRFRTAIGYYKDSILYDEFSNPEVYYRRGFTYLMLTPADVYEDAENRRAARNSFLAGLDIIRGNYDREKGNQTSEMIQLEQDVRRELQVTQDIAGLTPVPKGDSKDSGDDSDDYLDFSDENYARLHAGLGQVDFLEAVGNNKDTSYKVALFHFLLADRASKRRRRRSGKPSLKTRIMNFFNLEEIMEDIPYIVEVAKIHNFMALSFRRSGNSKLVSSHFGLAKEALEEAKSEYPNDSRVYAEEARLAFYQEDFEKALVDIKKVLSETDFYADKREFLLLKGQILNKMKNMKKVDEAIEAFQWVLDREPSAIEAMLGRAMSFALKGDRTSATADLAVVLQGREKDPLMLQRVGDVYLTLGDRHSASASLLKAFYIDKDDIALVFKLGKVKVDLNETEDARDLLEKVIAMNSTSEWATEARKLLATF
jgi:tetratricopeptide (TPR) repeat protein